MDINYNFTNQSQQLRRWSDSVSSLSRINYCSPHGTFVSKNTDAREFLFALIKCNREIVHGFLVFFSASFCARVTVHNERDMNS